MTVKDEDKVMTMEDAEKAEIVRVITDFTMAHPGVSISHIIHMPYTVGVEHIKEELNKLLN